MISRRHFLSLLGASAVAAPTQHWLPRFAPTAPSGRLTALEDNIAATIGEQPLGLDLRAVDLRDGYQYFRITNNAFRLYPVASCFKVMAVLYYLLYTPQDDWQTDADSAAFRVATYSNNPMTGDLLVDTAPLYAAPGNAIEKFNHFLRFVLQMQNGLTDWNWPGSPTVGMVDPVYQPSTSRNVLVGERRIEMDNLFFPSDLANVWNRLLTSDPFPDEPQGIEAARMTLRLFSFPADVYESPIEQVYGEYVGKDGVIPADDSPVGRVINDAGFFRVGQGVYLMSAMWVGSDYTFLRLLEAIIGHLQDYEGVEA